MRKTFENELRDLNLMMLDMGAKVEKVIKVSLESLLETDKEKASMVKKLDNEVDRLEADIEKKCLDLFLLQAPVASDLRFVGSVLKIITELERVGDYGVNISNVVLEMEGAHIKPLVDIPKMADICQEMLGKSLDSFINRDPELAKVTAKMDDEVDRIYDEICLELLEKIEEDKSGIKKAIDLLFVGRYLERMGDHITNVCERVVFMCTGETVSY
jgi:phosphate transport system protein